MSRSQPPGRRPTSGGSARRLRPDDTLPGVQFPVVEDLTRIAADDEFLDAIAAGGADLRSVFAAAGGNVVGGHSTTFDGSGNARRPVGLGPLLVAWRSELLEPPFPELPTLAPRPMRAPADRSRRRSMRSLLSVGAAICALLMASTAVGAHSAQPGQPLWGLSQVLWSGHADSVEAKVNAQQALEVAFKAVASGDRSQALVALDQAHAAMTKVSKDDGLGDLQRDYTRLSQQAAQLPPGPGSGSPSVNGGDTVGRPGVGPAVGSSSGGLIPPVVSSSSGVRTTAPTSPTAPSVRPPGTEAAATTVGGPSVAQGTGAGPVGNPPPPVTNLPNGPGLPATSSPVVPANPDTTNAGTTGPVTTAPGTTDGSTVPVQPSTPAPVVTTAPTTPAPDTTADPTAPPPTDPSTTAAPTTDAPATSTADPSTSSADPTTAAPTTDAPTTGAPTPTTTAAPTASTTSEIPTTLESTPSTDSDGSTLSDTSTTTTQTGPVNSTDGTGTTAGDPDTGTIATGEPGDPMARTEQSGG